MYMEETMSRFDSLSTKELIKLWIEEENRRQFFHFRSINPNGGHYTQEQKKYAIEKAKTIGVRAVNRRVVLRSKSAHTFTSLAC